MLRLLACILMALALVLPQFADASEGTPISEGPLWVKTVEDPELLGQLHGSVGGSDFVSLPALSRAVYGAAESRGHLEKLPAAFRTMEGYQQGWYRQHGFDIRKRDMLPKNEFEQMARAGGFYFLGDGPNWSRVAGTPVVGITMQRSARERATVTAAPVPPAASIARERIESLRVELDGLAGEADAETVIALSAEIDRLETRLAALERSVKDNPAGFAALEEQLDEFARSFEEMRLAQERSFTSFNTRIDGHADAIAVLESWRTGVDERLSGLNAGAGDGIAVTDLREEFKETLSTIESRVGANRTMIWLGLLVLFFAFLLGHRTLSRRQRRSNEATDEMLNGMAGDVSAAIATANVAKESAEEAIVAAREAKGVAEQAVRPLADEIAALGRRVDVVEERQSELLDIRIPDDLVTSLNSLKIGKGALVRLIKVADRSFTLSFRKERSGYVFIDGIREQSQDVKIGNVPSVIRRAASKGRIAGIPEPANVA